MCLFMPNICTIVVVSWLQFPGTDPRIWTKEVTEAFSKLEIDESTKICSVSTSLATSPFLLAPLFKNRVPRKFKTTKYASHPKWIRGNFIIYLPANLLDLRPIRVNKAAEPYILILAWSTNPWITVNNLKSFFFKIS